MFPKKKNRKKKVSVIYTFGCVHTVHHSVVAAIWCKILFSGREDYLPTNSTQWLHLYTLNIKEVIC